MSNMETAVLRLLAVLVTAGALLYFVPETYDHFDKVAAHTPDGFVSEIVVDSILRPMDLAFAPDGRIFIASKTGSVWIVKDEVLLPTPFTQVLQVNSTGQRGLMGLALDPGFATNGYVYLFFTYENNPLDLQGPKTARLIRVTADGDVAVPGSELVILGSEVGTPSQPSCEDFPAGTDCIPADSLSHTGGALRFAPDGKLLLATGDAAWNTVNWDELKLRSQDLDSLAGKLLRINPDGSAPTDNPLYTGDSSANRSKVWSYGLRQPFRMGIDPVTGLPFIGDVSSRYWEEINVAEAGSNFGWPCYEGYTQHPTNAALPFCQDMFANETVTAEPLYSYDRSPGAAVVGGSFSQTTNYPEEFQNTYFFGDWLRQTIYTLKVDENGALLPESGHEFLTDGSAPIAFATGLDGEIYYLAWPAVNPYGQLRHIAFTEVDQDPVAQASASPMGGLAPLTVQFSSDGSYDPEGGALTFFWDFDDGTNSNAEHPVHTFDTNGVYNVGLTVTDEAGNSGSVTLSIIVTNKPPKATISTPDPRTVYQAWDVIAFAGYGVDPEDGEVAASDTQWTVVLHHCEPVSVSCHIHPFLEVTGLVGSLVTPDQGAELYYLELRFTVVDSSGLSDTDVIFIGPDSDGDGLLDFEEVITFGTNYLNPDSDGDGISDGAEDPDADGCTNVQELGLDETVGGLRDPFNPWDFYDVAGLSGPTPDGVIDLLFDMLGVIQHYSPQGAPPYDVAFDRGPSSGPNPWNMTAPDGSIDLLNDILGVVQQHGHDCR